MSIQKRKRGVAWLVSLTMTLSMCANLMATEVTNEVVLNNVSSVVTTSSVYEENNETVKEDDTILITSAEQLDAIRENLQGNYELANDIDLSGIDFEPIGTKKEPFTGTLNGKGYSINNLVIKREYSDYVGLFGVTMNATFKDIVLDSASINGGDCVGSLIGDIRGEESSIEGCCIKNVDVTGSGNYIGGLAGVAEGEITRCYVTGNVQSSSSEAQCVGGLVGSSDASADDYSEDCYIHQAGIKITKSYVVGNTRGIKYVGGIIGSGGR